MDIKATEPNPHTSEMAHARFKQQVFSSVAGGMFIGLVGTVTGALLGGGVGFLGLAAVGVLAVGCAFMAALYLTKATSLEQDAQAEKICRASHGQSPALAPVIATQVTQPMGIPDASTEALDASQAANAPLIDMPSTLVSNVAMHEKMNAMEMPSRAFH